MPLPKAPVKIPHPEKRVAHGGISPNSKVGRFGGSGLEPDVVHKYSSIFSAGNAKYKAKMRAGFEDAIAGRLGLSAKKNDPVSRELVRASPLECPLNITERKYVKFLPGGSEYETNRHLRATVDAAIAKHGYDAQRVKDIGTNLSKFSHGLDKFFEERIGGKPVFKRRLFKELCNEYSELLFKFSVGVGDRVAAEKFMEEVTETVHKELNKELF